MTKNSRGVTSAIFRIGQSVTLVYGLFFIHFIAMLAAFQNALEISVRMAVIFLISVNLLFCLKRGFEDQPNYIRYGMINGWEIAKNTEQFSVVEIMPSTVVSSHLIVLHFKQTEKLKQTLFILKDALLDDEYRKLMVQLRIAGLKSI